MDDLSEQLSAFMDRQASVATPFPEPRYAVPGVEAPPVPGVIDLKQARQLEERDFVAQVQGRRKESREARRELEEEWYWYYSLYQNRHPDSYSEKLAWQAQVFIPHIQTKVDSFCLQVKQALLSQERFFNLDGTPGFSDIDHLSWLEKILALLLRKARFVDEYSRGTLRDGALFGTGFLAMSFEHHMDRSPHIVEVPSTDDPQMLFYLQQMGYPTSRLEVKTDARVRSKLSCRHVPLLAAFPDPFAPSWDKVKYFIEEVQVDECDIDEGVQAGIFDSAKDLGSPAKWDLEADIREIYSSLPSTPHTHANRKRHLLQIYYGDFYGPNGKVCLKNWRAVVANNKVLLALGPNDTYRGSIPYICSTPKPFPGRVWGRSMIEAAAGMNEELNDLFNLMLDSQTLSILPATTTNVNALSEPTDFGSVEPGRNYKTTAGDAIQQIKLASAPNEGWPTVQKLEQSIDLATMISQISQGLPTSKGRPTATEISATSSASQAHSSGVASDIERNDIVAAVELAHELAMQALDPASDPEVSALVESFHGPQYMMDKAARLRLLDNEFRVKVTGISGYLKRGEMIQKSQQALQLGAQLNIPPSELLGLYYFLLRQMDVDPADIGLPPSLQESRDLQAAMAQQAAMNAGGQGPGAGSQLPGGAPENVPGGGLDQPAQLPDDGARSIMAQRAAGV